MLNFISFALSAVIGPWQGFVIFIIMAIFLIPFIIFLISLQKILEEISFENRKMPPQNVWLSLIPLFGLIWQFFIVNNVAESLNAEFLKRSITNEGEKPGYSVGIAYSVLFCCSILPIIGPVSGIVGFICWIIYWGKAEHYKNLLRDKKRF